MTFRAIQVLKEADLVLAEDTRSRIINSMNIRRLKMLLID